MKNKDLIKLLLDCPMDMEVALGLPEEDGGDAIDCWDLNRVSVVPVNGNKIIMIFWDDLPDANLN